MSQRIVQSRFRTATLLCVLLGLISFASIHCVAGELEEDETHWSLRPLSTMEVPDTEIASNPIDAFLSRTHRENGISPLHVADKLPLLRRITLDLIGLPPTIDEQDDFLSDASADAYGKVVERLLNNQQHGVRYARHWLDVLRYADEDATDGGRMPAGKNLYLWRDWVVNALNDDVPYDEFVRVQITGYRSTERTRISAVGIRSRIEPRPDDLFALGFLSRNATRRDDKNQALAINAVETISTTFMGMTVGCAKCHDHFYDPIEQHDFYAMKALFDPLKLRPIQLATAQQVFDHGRQLSAFGRKKRRVEKAIENLTRTYRQHLYNERVEMLPRDIQAIIRKKSSHGRRTKDCGRVLSCPANRFWQAAGHHAGSDCSAI